jgi:hypothetical protein
MDRLSLLKEAKVKFLASMITDKLGSPVEAA